MEPKEKVGITEILDLLIAVRALTLDAIDKFGDGFDVSDFSVLTDNLDHIKKAIDGCTKIPEEAKDLSIDEIGQLTNVGVQLTVDIVKAVKAIKKKDD